jgi:molecular chaperone GrpE
MSKPKKQEKPASSADKQDCPQCEEYKAGWKRALADYENLKKQTQKEKEEFAKFANLNLILELIPVYNNFKLSFEHLPDEIKDNNWVKGVDHIEKQFMKVLEDNGLQQIIPQVNDEFNPQEMEAVESNGEKNKIDKVVAIGYKLKDKVVVPAKVIVK